GGVVLVCENSGGDFRRALGAATAGGLGFCPGANVGAQHAVFETTHGSAPSLAGKNKANPLAAILAGAMMLERLGEGESARRIVTAVEDALREKRVRIDGDGCARDGTKSVAEAGIRQIGAGRG